MVAVAAGKELAGSEKLLQRRSLVYCTCAQGQAAEQSREAAVSAVLAAGSSEGNGRFSPERGHLAAKVTLVTSRCDGDWPAAADVHELRKAVEINS
jgi:hypothetical protein